MQKHGAHFSGVAIAATLAVAEHGAADAKRGFFPSPNLAGPALQGSVTAGRTILPRIMHEGRPADDDHGGIHTIITHSSGEAGAD